MNKIDRILFSIFGFISIFVSGLCFYDTVICLSYGLAIPAFLITGIGIFLLFLALGIFQISLRK
jgi:hypothetical protein